MSKIDSIMKLFFSNILLIELKLNIIIKQHMDKRCGVDQVQEAYRANIFYIQFESYFVASDL